MKREGEENKSMQQGVLVDILAKSKDSLILYLSDSLDDEDKEKLLNLHPVINKLLEQEPEKKVQAIKSIVATFVEEKLKFPDAEKLINAVQVIKDYYDISDELILSNEDFKNVIEKYIDQDNKEGLVLRQYSEGYES